MSASGELIRLKNGDFNVSFGRTGNFVVEVPVVNEDEVSDYAIQVDWSINAGSTMLGEGSIDAVVGPGSTRNLELDVDTQLDPGTELDVCIEPKVDPDSVTGL
jgi:hypothetical protein